jgi:serine/threonine protein kinase
MNQSRELRPGQRVGNYTLHALVGRGAFAEVWRAAHLERPGRIVAIKIATDGQYARQLRREARRAGRLEVQAEMPNVVQPVLLNP